MVKFHRLAGILILAFLFLFPSSAAWGALYSVKLSVTDSQSDPEAYATVRIFAADDSVKALKYGTTDIDGRFNADLADAGRFKVYVDATGKKQWTKEFELTAAKPSVDFGTIALDDNATVLNEVTVTTLRPLIKHEIDRITYDVGADTEAPTSTLSETLPKVPMVTVDADGTIRVKGDTNFRIYKNGRPNSSYSNNAKELFKSIPASSIKKIEVITDPGSREDAEGGGLILNIVTDSKLSMAGVMGTVTQRLSLPDMRESTGAYLTTQLGKVTLSGNGSLSYAPKTKHNRSEGESVTSYDNGITSRTSSESRSKSSFGYWGLEGSWEPDTLNLITLEVSQWIPGNHRPDRYSTTSLTNEEGEVVQQYSSSYGDNYKRSSFYLDGAVNYQRLTRRKDEIITLSYNFSVNNSKNDYDTRYYDLVNWTMPYETYGQQSHRSFGEHTIQLDWSRPYGKCKLDVGSKVIIRRNKSDSRMFYDEEQVTKDKFLHRTTVAAVYADWRLGLAKWNFRAGVRYEYTYLAAHFLDREGYGEADERDDFSSCLNDIVPNAAVMYNFNDNNQLKLSYRRNIRRPGINALDPQVTYLPQSVTLGNPDLKSATIDRLELAYEHMGTVNLDASLWASMSDDGFVSVSWLGDDGLTVYNTQANVGRTRTAGFSSWLGWRGKKTRINFGFNIGYDHYKQPSPDGTGHDITLSRGGWWTNPYFYGTQTLPWKLNLSLSGSYWSGGVSSVYSKSKNRFVDTFYYSLTLSRSFLKEDRLTVRVSATKPFGPNRTLYKDYTEQPGMTSWSSQSYYGRQNVAFAVSYRFGSLRAMVKKTKTKISNDDVSRSRGGEGAQQ